MRRAFPKCLTFSLGLSFCIHSSWQTLARNSAADPVGSGLQVHVLVYNYAHVSPETLIKAEEMVSTIYQPVGLEPVWVNHVRTTGEAKNFPVIQYNLDQIDFVLRILPGSRTALKDNALREALPCKLGEEVCFANVFYNRVEQHANVETISLGQVLDHAVAHELGHVLLGSNSHFRRGIMTGQWSSEELICAARGISYSHWNNLKAYVTIYDLS